MHGLWVFLTELCHVPQATVKVTFSGNGASVGIYGFHALAPESECHRPTLQSWTGQVGGILWDPHRALNSV